MSQDQVMSSRFPFTPSESICINRRLRALIQGEVPEEHQEILKKINELGKNIFGLRINSFRALISQLALDESNVGMQAYVSYDQGKINPMKDTTLSACWNRSLADFYYCVESSMYDFKPESTAMIQQFLVPLQMILRATPVEAFLSQQAYDQFVDRFSFLESSIKDMDNQFPFLLNPADVKECFELSPRHIEIYDQLISFIIGVLHRYHKDASSGLRTFKNGELKNSFLKGILDLQNHAKSLKSDLGRLMPLFEMAEKGDQKAIFSLKKFLFRFTATDITSHLEKLFLPHLKALDALKNPPASVLSITSGYNSTLRHGIDLWMRMSDALFVYIFFSVEKCCAVIEKIQPLLNCRSAHLTPLDLCRHHWISDYILQGKMEKAISQDLGVVEVILQTLQSPGANIYQKNLNDLPDILKKLSVELPHGYSRDHLQMLQEIINTGLPPMLCAWLNHPLLQNSNHGNPHRAYLMLLSDLETYLTTCTKKIIIDNPIPDGPCVIRETDTVIMSEKLINEIKKLKEHENLEEHHLKDFCLNIALLFQPISTLTLQDLFADGITNEVREAMMIDLFLREDLRTLYLRSFLSLGRELGWTASMKRVSNPSAKETKHVSSVLKKDIHEIVGLSNPMKRALHDLIDVMDKPFSKEAIYRAAAQCLELVQRTTEQDPWRDRMLNHASIDFASRRAQSSSYEEDLIKTFAYLGIPREDIRIPELLEPIYGEFDEIESLRDLLFKAKFDLPLISSRPLEGESVIQAKWRDSMVYEILDAMLHDLDAVEQSLRKAQKMALPPFHLRFFILKAAQIVEGALMISLLRSAVATSSVMACLKNHDLAQMLHLLPSKKEWSDEEVSLLEKFKGFSKWVNDPQGHPSLVASLLSEGEKLYHGSEAENKQLLSQQKKLLTPEIKKLIGLSTSLLTSNEIM